MRKINRLNEEIARWAFEILFDENNEWKIAFTNPTAGPWKTIKAISKQDNTIGEVYRFLLEEDRPDVVMYNDKLSTVLIFEAKDELEKLLYMDQAQKSSAVVIKLAEILKNKSENKFWKGREKYKVILSLLWGANDVGETISKKDKLFDFYHKLIRASNGVFSDVIIGVETLYIKDQLSCTTFYKYYSDTAKSIAEDIVCSLM